MTQTIFYIHGANCTPDSFNYLISGMPSELSFDYTMYDARTSDLLDIIFRIKHDVLENEEPVHLVGHSLGGVIAAVLAHELPEHIRSVTTIAAPFHGVEVPLFLRMLNWYDTFTQNIVPTNGCYAESRKPSTVPLHIIKTYGGNNPLLGYRNDGVVSLDSQAHDFADRTSEVPWNHFEVLMHPSIRNAIVEFIGNVDGVTYK